MSEADGGQDGVALNVRRRVVEVLELIASEESQLEYQTQAPGVHVAHEIFNQWEDWYRPSAEYFPLAFTAEELEVLRAFHEVYEQVCAETPQILPPIGLFVATEAWRRYSRAAHHALGRLRRTSLESGPDPLGSESPPSDPDSGARQV
ncbi:MAG: hypothetical protein H6704_27985 [Myxococcales bacterium]|nr:hypothetical protein [Myxococcales bacterium]